jgi:hypothetical protein
VPLFDLVFICPGFGFPAEDFPPAQGGARVGFGFYLETEISVRCLAHGSRSSLVFSHVIRFFLSYSCSSLSLHFSSLISFSAVHILSSILNSGWGLPDSFPRSSVEAGLRVKVLAFSVVSQAGFRPLVLLLCAPLGFGGAVQ